MSWGRAYLVYDERACGGNTDRAAVLDVCYSLEEARKSADAISHRMDDRVAIYSYEALEKLELGVVASRELEDERRELTTLQVLDFGDVR